MKQALRKFFREDDDLKLLFKRLYTSFVPEHKKQQTFSMLQTVHPQISIGSLGPATRDACEEGTASSGFKSQIFQIEYVSVVNITNLNHANPAIVEKEEVFIDKHDDDVEYICGRLLEFENGGIMEGVAIARLDIGELAGSFEGVDHSIIENVEFIRSIIRVEIKYYKKINEA